ncbi:HTTM domain-containing protein [Primorskyibacter sp. S187A]|uniref:HTTM domain-containing protein n=1 Tax=Primorskyibacter sp. S187A TaxID=3415130 RepID=UPI003C7B0E2C
MSFDLALRLSEIALAVALLQRALEHVGQPDRAVFLPQIPLALLLTVGVAPALVTLALWLALAAQLWRFQGPYNGGADKMVFLVLTCVMLAHFMPPPWAEMAMAYLAVQLTLSYVVSGWVKLRHPPWRSGEALARVFRYSAYPVSTRLRGLADHPGLMWAASLSVIAFEVLFPLALVSSHALWGALAIAALFHLSNACLLGLNRFFWAWLAAFPSLIWFQGRFVAGVL